MYDYGNWKDNGVYDVKPLASPKPFQVLCRHITHTRTYVMQKKKKKSSGESFDRTWEDYKEGFGDMNNDFWIGLEKLHLLTSADRQYKLRVNIKLINNSFITYSYEAFKVSNETQGFRLSFNHSLLNGTDDCLASLHGAPFSTRDSDNDDNADLNCALTRKGGFWFRGEGCSSCNPLGVIYGAKDGLLQGEEDEAYWATLGDAAPYKINMYLVTSNSIEE